MSAKKSGDTIIFTVSKKKLQAVILAIVLLVGAVTVGYFFIRSIQQQLAQEDYLENGKDVYVNENMGFTCDLPPGWYQMALDERDTLELALMVANMKDEDGNFNILTTPISQEIVPFVLLQEGSTDSSFNSFLSLSFKFRGTVELSELQETLENELTALLDDLEDVTVTRNEVVEDGVYIQAEGLMSGTPVYYTQFSRMLSENMVTVIAGSKDSSDFTDVVHSVGSTVRSLR